MNRYYFLYRRAEFWLLSAALDLFCIAIPIWEAKDWAQNTKLDYVDNRLLEAKTARKKYEEMTDVAD